MDLEAGTKSVNELHVEKKFRKVAQKYLSEESTIVARQRFGETEESIQNGIDIIRRLISEHEISFHENDACILRFLRFRKYDYKRTIETIKYHMDMASSIDRSVGFPDPEVLTKIYKSNITGVLPYQGPNGRAILYGRKASALFDEISAKEVMLSMLVTSFCIIQDPATQVNGLTLILDAKDLDIRKISGYVECMRLNLLILKCNPGGFKRIDIINTGFIAKLMLKIARPFMPFKLAHRIVFHEGGPEGLLEYYDPSILPYEFGGTLGPISNDHFTEHITPTCNYIRNHILKYSNANILKTSDYDN